MTAGFHFGELKQYQILKRLERVGRNIIDVCLTSCFIFVMNKSCPQVTICAPAPGEELAAVQIHCTAMVSKNLGEHEKIMLEHKEKIWNKWLWKPESHKLTPLDEVSPFTSVCQNAQDAQESLMTTVPLSPLAFTLWHCCHSLSVNLTWSKHFQWWKGAQDSSNALWHSLLGRAGAGRLTSIWITFL